MPFAIIGVWLVGAAVGGPYFGKIEEVSTNDPASFLPESAEATEVSEKLKKFRDESSLPAIVVFESQNDLKETERTKITEAAKVLDESNVTIDTVSPPIYSEDKRAAIVIAPISSEAEFDKVIEELKTEIKDINPGVGYYFTGPAMFSRDLNSAFAGIDGTLLITALSVVFVILLIVYRSPILPILTLVGALSALTVSVLSVWYLADMGWVTLNGQTQGILFILVIGAASDYALLYIARYREELTHFKSPLDATKAAWKGSFEPILAAGGTVTLGLLCLLISDLGSNKSLGPIGGVGILFSVLVALTFLPAALLILGRSAFWPRRPIHRLSKPKNDYRLNHPAWARVANLVGKHPRRVWVLSLSALLIACIAVPQLRAQGVSQDNLIIGESEARDGQAVLNKHFAAGSGSPAYIVVGEDNNLTELVSAIEAVDGVDTVSAVTSSDNTPELPLGARAQEIKAEIRQEIESNRSAQLAEIRSNIEDQLLGSPQFVIDQVVEQAQSNVPSVDSIANEADPFKDLSPKVVDGQLLLQATLTDAASSIPARQTVERLRSALAEEAPGSLVGGVSAIQLDTNTAADRDIVTVIPLILLAITVVLMVLLRAVIGPLLLLLTTVISFGATIGVAALLFNNVWDFAGADPSVIVFGFVFLVALGIDYNIFLMTRVREETVNSGVRAGTLKALVVTLGGILTFIDFSRYSN